MKTKVHFFNTSLNSSWNEKDSEKICSENQNTHFVFNFPPPYPPPENLEAYDTVEKYGTARQATDSIIRRMRFPCWIPKATNTYSECVILIAFPLQQWLHDGA